MKFVWKNFFSRRLVLGFALITIAATDLAHASNASSVPGRQSKKVPTVSADKVAVSRDKQPKKRAVKSSTKSAVAKKPAKRTKPAPRPVEQSVFIDHSNVILPDVPTKQLALRFSPTGSPLIEGLDALALARDADATYATDQEQRRIYLTLDPQLQAKAQQILERYRVPWGALVVLEPQTGRVKALASASRLDSAGGEHVATRATFPAASLFKMVTAAAAIERGGVSIHEPIKYRGSDYTLSQWNYLPDPRRDRRVMNFSTALGKSVNPVFARVALQSLNAPILERYALNFGFNSEIPFDTSIDMSRFTPATDAFELARTAAGFTNVRVSPLHAALITAAIANSGKMMRPFLVDRIVAPDGKLEYQARAASLRYPILSSTAQKLLEMMKSTVEIGTAHRQFAKPGASVLRNMEIAAKTGTLSGDDPKGMYYWFVAAAPAENPEIAVAALVIDPGGARVRGTGLGRDLLEYYFANHASRAPTEVAEVVRIEK